MLADTTLLLRLYWTIDRRSNVGVRLANRTLVILGVLAAIGISGALGYYAANLISELSLLHIRVEILPGLLLTVVMFGVIFVGFSQALQALYLSVDLEKLLVAPVRPQAVIIAKLLSRTPTTITILLLATLPALITFGVGLKLGVLYYLIGALLLLATPLFGIGLGALLAMFLVRLLPARRLGEWLGAASIVFGLLLAMAAYIPSILGGKQRLDASTLSGIEHFVNGFGEMPLPSLWAGAALISLGKAQFTATALGAVALYLALTIGLFAVVLLLANKLYLPGWLRMQSAGVARQDIGDQSGVFSTRSLNFILGYKDWLLRIRDPRMLASLFTAAVLAGFALFLMLRPEEDGTTLLDFAKVSGLSSGSFDPFAPGVIISGLLYFAGYIAFSQMSITALSIEQRAVYILKTAPISASRLFRAKTFGIFVPYAVLSALAMIITLFFSKFSLIWLPYAILVLWIMGYGLFSFLVSLGFIYPKLDWDDPRRMANKKAGFPNLLGSLGYSLAGMLVADITFVIATGAPAYAVPVTILGLALLAGGTWFFVQRRAALVEKAWLAIDV